MSYRLRKAIRTEAKPLIGLYAESNGGKTYSSLLLAKGFCGGMDRVCMVETEAGRGEVWANHAVVGGYSVIPLRDDFSPKAYGEAIAEAEKAQIKALIIDSASHEWEGVGGVLGMAAENQAAGKKGPIVWQKPKMEHKREFMLRLQQTPIPLVIVCMRAKYPMVEKRKPNGDKEWVRSEVLEPIQADDILFDMFVHGWLDREQHKFHATKYTVDDLRQVFIDGEPISTQTGERLSGWAKGIAAPQATPAQPPSPPQSGQEPAEAAFITTDQAIALEDALKEHGKSSGRLLANISRSYGQTLVKLTQIRAADYTAALEYARGA